MLGLPLVLWLAAANAGTAETGPREECHLYRVVVEFVVDPSGKMTYFRFYQPMDCRDNAATPPISSAWKKTACVTLVLDRPGPTYEEGQVPKARYSVFLFNSKRPGVVFSPTHSGATPDKPVIYVREEILGEPGTAKDGSIVCDQSFVYLPLPPKPWRERESENSR